MLQRVVGVPRRDGLHRTPYLVNIEEHAGVEHRNHPEAEDYTWQREDENRVEASFEYVPIKVGSRLGIEIGVCA